MKYIFSALLLMGISMQAYACYTYTYIINGRTLVCTVCEDSTVCV
jgi:hypothetical protein